MLKATMQSPRGSGGTLLTDFMVLEEGETLVSVRNPGKRQEALDLLEQIKVEYDTNCTSYKSGWCISGVYRNEQHQRVTARFNSMTNRLFQMLLDNFLPTRPPEEREMVEEIGRLLKHPETINIETCYNSTFAIYIIRKALKDYELPLVMARLWKVFAGPYCALVMSV